MTLTLLVAAALSPCAVAAPPVEVGVHGGYGDGFGNLRTSWIEPFGAGVGADAGAYVGRVWLGASATAFHGWVGEPGLLQLDRVRFAAFELGYGVAWRSVEVRPYLSVGVGRERYTQVESVWAWAYGNHEPAAAVWFLWDIRNVFPESGVGVAVHEDVGPIYVGLDTSLVAVTHDREDPLAALSFQAEIGVRLGTLAERPEQPVRETTVTAGLLGGWSPYLGAATGVHVALSGPLLSVGALGVGWPGRDQKVVLGYGAPVERRWEEGQLGAVDVGVLLDDGPLTFRPALLVGGATDSWYDPSLALGVDAEVGHAFGPVFVGAFGVAGGRAPLTLAVEAAATRRHARSG